MARVVLLVILAIVLSRAYFRLVDGIRRGLSGAPPGSASRASAVQMRRDPVCGTFVVPSSAVSVVDNGRSVYFCSTSCRDRYQTDRRQGSRTA
jgi:YHS domain-containing protein